MNEATNLDELSYKELQEIAGRYKVRRNITKDLLIKVLQAKKEGNDHEAKRILCGVEQTRKKRPKKQSTKQLRKIMSIQQNASYSPDFNDMYYSGNSARASHEWGLNEDPQSKMTGVINRPENRGQMPNYVEFNQFLNEGALPSIQDDYGYHSRGIRNTNERAQSPTIVDLRINPRRMGDDCDMQKSVQFAQFHQDTDYKRHDFDAQLMSYESPRLLKKMLQAPAGVNLKELVSYDGSCEMRQPILDNDAYDSDTLTADSDSNAVGNQMDTNHNNWITSNGENVFQNYDDHQMEPYFNYSTPTDVIQNCQKWLINSSSMLPNREPMSDPIDCDYYQKSANYDQMYYYTPDPQFCPPENHYQPPMPAYEYAPTIVEKMEPIESYSCENPNIDQASTHNNQWSTYAFLPQNREAFYENPSDYVKFDPRRENDRSIQNQSVQYAQETYETDFPAAEGQQLEQLFETNFVGNEIPISENILERFWPRRVGENEERLQGKFRYKLENLVNLEGSGEKPKSDQTSCVYCYTQPIVAQRIFSGGSPSSQQSPESEGQEPTLVTNSLVYREEQGVERKIQGERVGEVRKGAYVTSHNNVDNPWILECTAGNSEGTIS